MDSCGGRRRSIMSRKVKIEAKSGKSKGEDC